MKMYFQKWEERERNWGIRPDGFSLHTSLESREKFIKDYWDKMPEQTPDEYSRPDGDPILVELTAEELKKYQPEKFYLDNYKSFKRIN